MISFWIVLFRQMTSSEPQDSLSLFAETFIHRRECSFPSFILLFHLSIQIGGIAEIPNSFWSSLSKKTIVGVWSFVFHNDEGIFIGGIEWHSSQLPLSILINLFLRSSVEDVFNWLEKLNQSSL